MSRICLLTLIGLPGAGKTSLCSWLLAQQLALKGSNILHICYDDYLKPQEESNYKDQRLIVYHILIELLKSIQNSTPPPADVPRQALNAESKEYLILCDDNFYYGSMRHKLYQLCRRFSCVYAQIYVDSPLAKCLEQNARRSSDQQVPEATIQQMHLRLEPPGTDSWETLSLNLSQTQTPLNILEFINSLYHQPTLVAPQPSPAPPQMPVNLIHHLDLQLRARIKYQLSNTDPKQPKSVKSLQLNEKRKHILAQFRQQPPQQQMNDLDYFVNLLN